MNLQNERKEEVFKFDVDLSDKEARSLREIGLDRIKNDDQALIEYAIVALLEEKITDKE